MSRWNRWTAALFNVTNAGLWRIQYSTTRRPSADKAHSALGMHRTRSACCACAASGHSPPATAVDEGATNVVTAITAPVVATATTGEWPCVSIHPVKTNAVTTSRTVLGPDDEQRLRECGGVVRLYL